MKVIVIGGGASGMLAALSAAEDKNNEITLLERQNRVGRKLLATGNGRCNLTNVNAAPSRYPGGGEFAAAALKRFSVDDTLAFFSRLGLYTVTEPDGRVYPLSDQANSVVDVLRFALEQENIAVETSCDVVSVARKARGFSVTSADGRKLFADKLIVAAGGCAGKTLGGTKSGYRLLSMLGHSATDLRPSLVQIKTDPTFVRALKGVRADAALTAKTAQGVIAKSEGEVQFTDFGVSGPAAFDVSRAVSCAEQPVTLLLDLLRGTEENEIITRLRERAKRFPALAAAQLLTGMLNTRLGQTLLKFAKLDPAASLKDLKEDELARLAHAIKYFALEADGVLGMEHAQVTAGGVCTGEFRADTLESRLVPGLFATGEVLDVDGDCGGFNLQWAWSSGYVAGKLGGGA